MYISDFRRVFFDISFCSRSSVQVEVSKFWGSPFFGAAQARECHSEFRFSAPSRQVRFSTKSVQGDAASGRFEPRVPIFRRCSEAVHASTSRHAVPSMKRIPNMALCLFGFLRKTSVSGFLLAQSMRCALAKLARWRAGGGGLWKRRRLPPGAPQARRRRQTCSQRHGDVSLAGGHGDRAERVASAMCPVTLQRDGALFH